MGLIRFHFFKNGSDTIFQRADSLVYQGRWEVNGDSLHLIQERLTVNSGIDSLSYHVDKGNPSLIFFNEGQEIARQGIGEIESPRRSNTFHIQQTEEDQMILTSSSGEKITLYGRLNLTPPPFDPMNILRGLLGILFVLAFCWMLSTNRKAIDWRLVAAGISLQLFFAILVLKVPGIDVGFQWVANVFVEILGFTRAGTAFLFSSLGLPSEGYGVIFAFSSTTYHRLLFSHYFLIILPRYSPADRFRICLGDE